MSTTLQPDSDPRAAPPAARPLRYAPEEWQERMRRHEEEVSALIDGYLERRSRQVKDPVMDFLFEYYAFRPSRLKRWSPGTGVLLEGADAHNAPELSELVFSEEGARLDPAGFPENRIASARWICDLLRKTLERPPSFGCFGMHEWAMVYKRDADKVRHAHLPLRMNPQELAEFVESRPLVCTHFDAYRFFTEAAKPLNRFELDRDRFGETEQAGCLHTNMDLYKWAFKMHPWVSGETLRSAFKLAVEARHIDMKASPYDLSDRGMEPIRIETEEGRMEYLEAQQAIHRRSQPVRKQLLREYSYLLRLAGD